MAGVERSQPLIKRVAPTDGTVLVTGESGTGKEMVVRAIHRLSRRKDHSLLACDCTALAPTLLESEIAPGETSPRPPRRWASNGPASTR